MERADTRDQLQSLWTAIDYSAREMMDGAMHVSRVFTFVFAVEELRRLGRIAAATDPSVRSALAAFDAIVPMRDGRIAGRDEIVGTRYWDVHHRDGHLVLGIGSVSIPVVDVRVAASALYSQLKPS